jgi:hypothetical protein
MKGVQLLRIIPERLVGLKPFFVKKTENDDNTDTDVNKDDDDDEVKIKGGEPDQYGGARTKMISSNIRAEIEGGQNLQYYCQHNSLDKMYNTSKFTQKKNVINPKTGKPFERLDYEDFNFRVSYQEEEDFGSN